jgi:crossover junction endodeoxyribonuclease RusA
MTSDSKTVTCFVPGTPRPEGALRIYRTKTGGRNLCHASGNKLRAWRKIIALKMSLAWRRPPTDKAIHLEADFHLPRPKKLVRPYPTVKLDSDKLLRAVLDALTGVVYEDDGQVVNCIVQKRYAPFDRMHDNEELGPGVDIMVRVME